MLMKAVLVPVVVPFVAAGVAIAVYRLASVRRWARRELPRASAADRDGSRVFVGAAGPRPGRAISPVTSLEGPRSEPTVLPIAFWDAASARLDDEDAPPTARAPSRLDAYDSIAPEDLGVEWLGRATEAFEPSASADDPAEVAADSVSMVSQASRFAATREQDAPPSSRADVFEWNPEPQSERS